MDSIRRFHAVKYELNLTILALLVVQVPIYFPQQRPLTHTRQACTIPPAFSVSVR